MLAPRSYRRRYGHDQFLETTADGKWHAPHAPVAIGRMSGREGARFAVLSSLVGIGYLQRWNRRRDASGALSWASTCSLYAAETRKRLAHAVGAVAGRSRVAWRRNRRRNLHPIALALFGVVFFWQFGHGRDWWMYREQCPKAK